MLSLFKRKDQKKYYPCIGDILGQQTAKQALLIAAAGGHNLFMIGPPGEGKTTLAKTMTTYLPPLDDLELKALDRIYAAKYFQYYPSRIERPFVEAHHSTSIATLLGSYSAQHKSIVPGLVSLASFGVLFLDELSEFSKDRIEALRQPLTSDTVTIHRSQGSTTYPSCFQLIAASNPCPCGYAGSKHCTCSTNAIARYLGSLSGPILDRIDIITPITNLSPEERLGEPTEDQSKLFYSKVMAARVIAYKRNGYGINNADLPSNKLFQICRLSESAKDYLLVTMEQTEKLSTRKLHKLCKVARTIADLVHSKLVDSQHIQLAAKYVLFDLHKEYVR